MFNTAFLLSLALVSFVVQAKVEPNTPSGLDTYKVGGKCAIGWSGDTEAGSTKWKNMSIQFMTGANLDMVHLTTVVMDQDGTVDGTYEWDCPAVTPNSMIYFYQFRSPWIEDADTQWTTRFTIASASGETTEPTEFDTQDNVKWGTGTMEGGSPAPDFSSYSGAPGATSSSGGSTGRPPAASGSSSESSSSTESTSSASPSGTDSPSTSTDSPDASPSSTDSKSPAPSSSSTSSRMTRSSNTSSSITGTADSSESTDGGDGALSMGASSAALLFAAALAFVSL